MLHERTLVHPALLAIAAVQGSAAFAREADNSSPSQTVPRGVVPVDQREWTGKILNSLDRVSRKGVFGTVGLTLTVTPKGQAEKCVVTASSGYDELDEAVCRVVEKYGRFAPALDADGQPIAATWSTRVTTSPN